MTRARENSEPVYSATSTTRPANPYEGQIVYETDTKTISIYDGSGWIRWGGTITTAGPEATTVASHFGNGPFAMAAGTISFAISGTSASATVTFPVNRFPATYVPLVQTTLQSAAAGTQKLVPRAINTSNTAVSVYVYTGDSTTAAANITVAWLAIMMTSTSGSG